MHIMRLTKTNDDFIDYHDDQEFDIVVVGDALTLVSKLNKKINPNKPIDTVWYDATVEHINTSVRFVTNFRRDEGEDTYKYRAIICKMGEDFEFDLLDD